MIVLKNKYDDNDEEALARNNAFGSRCSSPLPTGLLVERQNCTAQTKRRTQDIQLLTAHRLNDILVQDWGKVICLLTYPI